MNPTRMTEPEVCLLLAFHLIESGRASSDVAIDFDGAHVRSRDTVRFDVRGFLRSHGWERVGDGADWLGRYTKAGLPLAILIERTPGRGDMRATMSNGQQLVVEAKKGPLEKCRSSSERPLLQEAIGQLLTAPAVPPNALLAVAVPRGPGFVRLIPQFRAAPLVKQAGISFLTVARTGEVEGLDL